MVIFKDDWDFRKEVKGFYDEGDVDNAIILLLIEKRTVPITDEEIELRASLCASTEDKYAFLSCWDYIKSRINQ